MSEFNKEFCPVCGKPLPLYKQMYCSRACREEAYRERWKKPKKEAVKKKKGLSWDEVIKGMAETGLSYVDYIKKYEDEVTE